MVEMELFEIRIDETNQEQVIVLREKEGERLLPILIGIFEAQAIHIKIHGERLPRPLTHDLLASVIEALGAELKLVLINKLQENTFYARLILERDGEDVEVDSRPSDAIALAIRVDAPLYVNEEVLEQVS